MSDIKEGEKGFELQQINRRYDNASYKNRDSDMGYLLTLVDSLIKDNETLERMNRNKKPLDQDEEGA